MPELNPDIYVPGDYPHDILVGAKFVSAGGELAEEEGPGIGMHVMWVKWGDVYLPDGVISITHEADVQTHTVTVKAMVGRYRTVDFRTRPQ